MEEVDIKYQFNLVTFYIPKYFAFRQSMYVVWFASDFIIFICWNKNCKGTCVFRSFVPNIKEILNTVLS